MTDRPTAAPARFPYTEHRSMAEVIAEERITQSHQRMLGKAEAA